MSIIYTYLVIAIIVLWLIHKIAFPKRVPLYCILVGVALFVVLGLRNVEKGMNVGVDLLRYANHYNEIKYAKDIMSASMHDALYPAYWGVNYIASLLNFTFQEFSTLSALVCIGSLTYYVIRNSKNQVISYFTILGMGVFTFWFSGLKQSYAMATALLFFDAYLHGHIKKSIIWLVVSILFHWASLILIPLLFVGRVKMTKLVVVSYIIALIFMTLFSMSFGYIITSLIVESYVGNYTSSGSIGGTAIVSLLILVLFIIFVYDNKKTNNLIVLHGMMILCMIQIAASYSYAFTRVNLFYMSGILAISVSSIGDYRSIKIKYKSVRKILSFSFNILWIVFMIYLYYSHIEGEQLQDYHFISALGDI